MEPLKIAGIDISKDSITVCILDQKPENLKQFNQRTNCPKFTADRAGIANFLALDFDVAVMEPTGIHYAQIWTHHLEKAGRLICWVGHREIRHYRESHKLPNKSDNADAIAIAAYSLERWGNEQAFIRGDQGRARELYLQLQSLTRSRTAIVNRLKQQLAHECPEMANSQMNREWLESSKGILTAIAGTKTSKKWEKVLGDSIGTGLSDFSTGMAGQILSIDAQQLGIEQELEAEMQKPEYERYLIAFRKLAIAGRIAAAILSQVYPIEQYLGTNGQPIIERVNGCKYYRSLASFKLSLGMGRVQYQSGTGLHWKNGGPAYLRCVLYQWCKVSVVMHPNLELSAIAKYRSFYESPESGVKNQRPMRVARRMVEDLFYELVDR